MLRKKIALTCLAAVVLCTAGFALAKAVKFSLEPKDGAAAQGLTAARGKANLNYAKGADKTEIQVNCWGLLPDERYGVLINRTFIGVLTTDDDGNGDLHGRLPGNVQRALVTVMGVADADGDPDTPGTIRVVVLQGKAG